MNTYIATVNYTIGNQTVSIAFNATARNEQYVKEQYHRYTHENYKSEVDRAQEIEHIHGIGDNIVSTLESIEKVDVPIPGLMDIRYV